MGKLEVKGDELASSTPAASGAHGHRICLFAVFHFIKLYKAGPAIIGEAPSLFKNLINRKQAFNSFPGPRGFVSHNSRARAFLLLEQIQRLPTQLDLPTAPGGLNPTRE